MDHVQEIKDHIAEELFQPQGFRSTKEANKFPDVKGFDEEGVDIEAIGGIVDAVIRGIGYHRIEPIIRPLRGRVHFGKLEEDGSVTYLKLTWDLKNQVFNPLATIEEQGYEHVELLELPPAHPGFIQGYAFGVDT